MAIDLDVTANCPVADTCEGCGGTHGLAVVTVGTQLGVYCLTLCMADRMRPLGTTVSGSRSVPATVHRVLEHCGHLGITADQMAAELE